ncbi:MAG: caspase family protein, partial [Phaeodactylibacter sp.]|nr:caspase family protein [Phaeodactylibacter sp.]
IPDDFQKWSDDDRIHHFGPDDIPGVKSIVEIAYHKSTSSERLAIIDGQQLKWWAIENEELKNEQVAAAFSDNLYWLAPDADFVLFSNEGDLVKRQFFPESKDQKLTSASSILALIADQVSGHVCVSREDGAQEVFNLNNPAGKELIARRKFEAGTQALAFYENAGRGQSFLIVKGETELIQLWNLKNDVLEKRFNFFMPAFKSMALAKWDFEGLAGVPHLNLYLDNDAIYSISLGGSFPIREINPPGASYHMAICNPVEELLIKIRDDKGVPRMVAGPEENSFPLDFLPGIMEYSPDGKYLAITAENEPILIFKDQNFDRPKSINASEEWTRPIALAFPHRQNVLAVAYHKGIHFFSLANEEPAKLESATIRFKEEWPKNDPYHISFSRYANYFCIQNKSKWDVLKFADGFRGPFQPLFTGAEGFDPEHYVPGGSNKEITASVRSPLFLREKKLLFDASYGTNSGENAIERKEGREIKIWGLDALQHHLDAGEKQIPANLAVNDIPYQNFCVLEDKPILLFLCRNEGIFIFDWEENRMLANFHLVDEKRFIILDDRNNYYSSPDGYQLVAFRYDKKVYPIEQFDLISNRPHEVLRRIGLSEERVIQDFSQAFEKRMEKGVDDSLRQSLEDRLKSRAHPKPKSISGQPEATAQLHLPELVMDVQQSKDKGMVILNFSSPERSPGQPALKTLHIHVNGVPLYGRAGKPLDEKDGILKPIEVKLSSGWNKIQASVIDRSEVESLKETFSIQFDGKRPLPKLYFIGIGIGEHDLGPRLNFPRPDIEKLAAALQAWLLKDEANPGLSSIQSKAPFNEPEAFQKLEELLRRFREEQLQRPEATFRELIIRTIFDRKATKAGIEDFLQKVKEKLLTSDVDDRIILYYSGHGLRDEKEGLILSTYDMNFEDYANKLSYESLEGLLDGIPARNKLLILDACATGELDQKTLSEIGMNTEAQMQERDKISSLYSLMKTTFFDLRRNNGATVIAGAQGWQEALEGGGLDHSVISYCIQELLGLIEKAPGQKGPVMVSNLIDYILTEVPRLMMEKSLAQEKVSQEKKEEISQKILGQIPVALPQKMMEEKLTALLEEFFALEEAERLGDRLSKLLQLPTCRIRNTYGDWRIW